MFLHPLDFAKMYKEHKEKTVFKGKSADDWNAKSKDMAPRVQKSAYVDDFISRMQLFFRSHDFVGVYMRICIQR